MMENKLNAKQHVGWR